MIAESAESSSEPVALEGVQRARSSPLINPEDFEHSPTKADPKPFTLSVQVQDLPPARDIEQSSPREIKLISPPVLQPTPVLAPADPPKYLEFAQDFDSYKSSQLCQSSPAYSISPANESVRVQVSHPLMTAPKPQAVSYLGLGFLAILAVISSCVLLGLELGSGMVKWKVAPLRLEVRPVSR